jgi:hypothetical protein
MHLFEIFLISIGTLLLVIAFYLGKRHADGDEYSVHAQLDTGLSPEKATKLQSSLTQLLHELQTLSSDMTADLDQKLSELKELLQLADNTLEEMSPVEIEEQLPIESTVETQAEKEESTESFEPEHQLNAGEESMPLPPAHRYTEIFQMEEEGLPIDEIARRMQMGKGEIQLILSLRQKD